MATPIKFKGSNVVYAENQPEYQPLPAMKFPDGDVITCWQLTDEEITAIFLNKCIYLKQSTFNQPLQPILIVAELGDDIGFTLPPQIVG